MGLTIDRYHAQMSEAAMNTPLPDGRKLADMPVRFYATQRKLNAAPVVGHERLHPALVELIKSPSERDFLEREGLGKFAFADIIGGLNVIRAPLPGTIMFANEPIADVTGKFLSAQAIEVAIEHTFDMPMTVASRAMDMTRAADGLPIMDFSGRRSGDAQRARDVAGYAFIGGFSSTSNGDAAKQFGIPWAGTVAHYWQQMFVPQHWSANKHFEQVAFEQWLDANPKGTTLLLDTIDVHEGIKHAAAAALSTPERLKAFKSYRIDSGNLAELALEAHRYFGSKGLIGLTAVLTGDLNAEHIARIVSEINNTMPVVFGVGTKLISEIERVAGVIYKACVVDNHPTLKKSNSIEKSTLPGRLQVYRGIDRRGNYVGDVIGLAHEIVEIPKADSIRTLLHPFFENQNRKFKRVMHIPTVQEQQNFVKEQLTKFGYLMNYPVTLSPELDKLRHDTIQRMV